MSATKLNKHQTNNYMYHHRIARTFLYLQSLKIKKTEKCEMTARSSMIGVLISQSHPRKLMLEGGILSCVPMYVENLKYGPIRKNFGNDVASLVKESFELYEYWVECDPDINELNGFSVFAKNINLYHTYIDLVTAFSKKKGKVMFDGDEFELTYKETEDGEDIKEIAIMDGESYDIEKFYQYLIELVGFKVQMFKCADHEILQCLRESIRQFKEQRGFVFQLTDSLKYNEATEDQSMSELGV